eukprot:4621376-Prymnesium_polylepis.1
MHHHQAFAHRAHAASTLCCFAVSLPLGSLSSAHAASASGWIGRFARRGHRQNLRKSSLVGADVTDRRRNQEVACGVTCHIVGGCDLAKLPRTALSIRLPPALSAADEMTRGA